MKLFLSWHGNRLTIDLSLFYVLSWSCAAGRSSNYFPIYILLFYPRSRSNTGSWSTRKNLNYCGEIVCASKKCSITVSRRTVVLGTKARWFGPSHSAKVIRVIQNRMWQENSRQNIDWWGLHLNSTHRDLLSERTGDDFQSTVADYIRHMIELPSGWSVFAFPLMMFITG